MAHFCGGKKKELFESNFFFGSIKDLYLHRVVVLLDFSVVSWKNSFFYAIVTHKGLVAYYILI
jgi:hypothetical protein